MAIVLFAAGSLVWATLASAAPSALLANFELDGNATDGAAAPIDWSNLYAGAVNGYDFTGIASDKTVKGGDFTMFTGGGSKDGLDIPGWQYKADGGLPAKDDITDAYGAATHNASNEKVIYFGADRWDNSGDAQIGFWFFQSSVSTTPGVSAGGFTGRHTQPNCRLTAIAGDPLPLCSAHTDPDVPVGDLLVLSDFTNGGATGTINAYEWVGNSGAPASDGNINHIYPSSAVKVDCQDDNASNVVCGTVNRGAALIPSPWPYENKSKQGQFFAKGEFYEGGINLGLLFPGANPCFASFLAETRSSSSPTAVLKDFVVHSFEPCVPSTTMATTPLVSATTVHTGDNVTFTFYEKNDGQLDLTNVYLTEVDGKCTPTSVNKTDDPATTTVDESLYNVGDTNNDGKLSAGANGNGEEWTFQCVTSFNATGTGTVTVNGHGTALGVDVTYPGDPEERATASVTVINPHTYLREDVSAVVTYTYYETNDGDSDISSPSVTSNCAGSGTATAVNQVEDPATPVHEADFNAGDLNEDSKLNVGETWTFRCTETLDAPNDGTLLSRTDNGEGHGTDAAGTVHNGTSIPDEKDSSTVTLKNNAPNGTP